MSHLSFQIAQLLEKMCSNDKDFRFMATNDLMSELQKDSIKLDDDSERKVVRMLMKLLEDKNGEVQNLAVKCLGPLVSKVKDSQVEVIVETLCSNMSSSKEQLRDISSIGLKTVIAELPLSASGLAAAVCKKITGRLSETIAKKEDVAIQLEAIEIMSDLLCRFGTLLVPYHGMIMESLLPQLSSARMAVIKRTITAISYLVLTCNAQLYEKLIQYLIDGLTRQQDIYRCKSYVLCLGSICRQAGHRLGEHIEKVLPLVFDNIKKNDDDLTEYCLQTLESFIYRCSKEITPHVHQIIKTCLEYIMYDPNYNYDVEDEEGTDDQMDTDLDAQESDDGYSDDDDVSWKVRRAATKCLESIIASRNELLPEIYRNVAPVLVSRFKEREESVKSDIFHAFIVLLKQTQPVIVMTSDTDTMEHESVVLSLLQQQVPGIVNTTQHLLKEKSVKNRHSALSLLSELVHTLPGVLAPHLQILMPGILYSLNEKTAASQMKCDTLIFIQTLIKNHSSEVIQPYVDQLIPPAVNAVNENFYKVISEGLLVLQLLVKALRPFDVPSHFDFSPFVRPIYNVTLARLKTTDIDQEVKEKAISCMGQVLASFGDVLQGELVICCPILLDRLKNEITRLATVRALYKVASSPLRIRVEALWVESMPVLATFLRKNQRNLKLSTLSLLNAIVQNYSSALQSSMLDQAVKEVPALLTESDLTAAQHALLLLTAVTKTNPGVIQTYAQTLLNETLNLAKSPLLQGEALKSLLSFLQAVAESGISGLSSEPLINHLQDLIEKGPLHKDAYHSLAEAVGALAVSKGADSFKIIDRFLKKASSKNTYDSQLVFSLLSVGSIGKRLDLSGVDSLKKVLIESFNSQSEDVRSAGSYALGSIAVGNLNEFLPFILQETESKAKRQYLLLCSLKEVISSHATSTNGAIALAPYIPEIWRRLFIHCESPLKGTRKIVAECLGKLTMMEPNKLLPELKAARQNESPLMRQTIITAVKFTISDQPQPIDSLLRQCIGDFLSTLDDPDLNVRMVALILFLSTAHQKPSLIRDLLDSLLPHIYRETNVRKELIREVEMGPFKHTVDDGLDMRKYAFECMYTMLDNCLDKLDIYEFLNHVESGLKDHYDIKMLTYLMLSRLTLLAPNTVLQRLEQLVEPLRSTLSQRVKANAVKQEYEKQDDLKRSALRAVSALQSVPDAEKNPQLNELMATIKSNSELMALYESIKKDTSAPTDQALMDLN